MSDPKTMSQAQAQQVTPAEDPEARLRAAYPEMFQDRPQAPRAAEADPALVRLYPEMFPHLTPRPSPSDAQLFMDAIARMK